MPSQRRMRLLLYSVVVAVVILLFYTSSYRASHEPDQRTIQDFYHKTMTAMDKKNGGGSARDQVVLDKTAGNDAARTKVDHDADGDLDEDDEQLAKQMADRLKAAEQKAKENANAKSPNKPDAPHEVIGVGSSAGGQGKKGGAVETQDEPEKESEEDHEIEQELNTILKKSPVIIFSKSYCQYSKRAKGILLEKYSIDPPPYVVELDLHPKGAMLQARLAEMTGRHTVPNIIINGKSIGGSDEIVALDQQKELASKVKTLGGKRVEVTERFVEDAAQKPV